MKDNINIHLLELVIWNLHYRNIQKHQNMKHTSLTNKDVNEKYKCIVHHIPNSWGYYDEHNKYVETYI